MQTVGLLLFGQLLQTLKCRNHILLHLLIMKDLLHRLQIHTFPISQNYDRSLQGNPITGVVLIFSRGFYYLFLVLIQNLNHVKLESYHVVEI